ncbi:cytochrome P-450 cyp509A1 [Fennellomyces sp. T-0311]|nr:cytochrome P-450 cyp509A1 [Fennellomyces sp. T-0311]
MNVLVDNWNNHVLPHIPDNARRFAEKNKVSISASIVLLGIYYLAYEKIAKPPRNLRHLPQVSFLSYIKAIIAKKPHDVIASEITLPVAQQSEQGLYTVFDKTGWAVHIARPEAAKKFLNKTNIFVKVNRAAELQGTLMHRFLLGPNVVFLNGKAWKHQRMIANPAFHRSMPIDLFGSLAVKLFKVMDSLEGPIDFHDMMERWTLDAIGKAGFDFDFCAIDDRDSEWVLLYKSIGTAVLNPLFVLFPMLDTTLRFLIPSREKKHQELTKFLGMLDGVIKQKRRTLSENKTSDILEREKDLLTLLIEAGGEGGKALTDEELKSNLCVFFTAGHDTTANALSFAAYHLAVNPDVQQKAREEAIRVLGDEPKDILPTQEQFQQMPYINQIIKEVLRFNGPAASLVVRQTEEDTDLAGVFIPKGARVNLNIYGLHHNPTVWKDPEVFNPDRFAPGGLADRAGLSWLPFSSGGRQCIGMNFSLAEQRVLLPMLLRKYEFSLPKDTVHKDKLVMNNSDVLSPQKLFIDFKKRY